MAEFLFYFINKDVLFIVLRTFSYLYFKHTTCRPVVRPLIIDGRIQEGLEDMKLKVMKLKEYFNSTSKKLCLLDCPCTKFNSAFLAKFIHIL
jgi:hypothetical protein